MNVESGIDYAATGPAPAADAAALVARAEEQDASPEWFSTAPGRELAAPPGWQLGRGGTWAFMWTDRADDLPPPPTGLVELDDTVDATRIEHFGLTHNVVFEGFPGRGYASAWLGVEDSSGELTAVGAIHVLGSGAAHLAGIVVRPDLRGYGSTPSAGEPWSSVSETSLAISRVSPPSHPDNTTGIQMPPKGGNPAMSDDDILDIIAYLRTLQDDKPAASAGS